MFIAFLGAVTDITVVLALLTAAMPIIVSMSAGLFVATTVGGIMWCYNKIFGPQPRYYEQRGAAPIELQRFLDKRRRLNRVP